MSFAAAAVTVAAAAAAAAVRPDLDNLPGKIHASLHCPAAAVAAASS